jgi:hypothetical protein
LRFSEDGSRAGGTKTQKCTSQYSGDAGMQAQGSESRMMHAISMILRTAASEHALWFHPSAILRNACAHKPRRGSSKNSARRLGSVSYFPFPFSHTTFALLVTGRGSARRGLRGITLLRSMAKRATLCVLPVESELRTDLEGRSRAGANLAVLQQC